MEYVSLWYSRTFGGRRAVTDVQREFLEFVWGEQEGYADIARMEDGDLKNHKWFEWPVQKEDLLAYVAKYSHEDIYYPPVLFKAPQRRRSAVKTAQVVYGDADLFKPENLYATPTCIVRTSPDKTHVLWRVSDTNDVATLEGLAHSVSLEHPKATTGYDNGWSATKLLRVPGTKNLKYEGQSFDVTVEYTGLEYTVAEFSESYALVPEMIFDPKPFPEEKMPSYTEALSSIPSSGVLEDLLRRRFNKGGSGSEALYLLYNELFRLGASDEQVYVIAEKSPLNKWKRDKVAGSSKLLWDDVQRARNKYGNPIEGDERDDLDEEAVITVAPRPKPKGTDL
jgi:hypothetical protein